jgi:NAD(P)-dependent dehydrogenase (short-subunit alcohol dehydrogenase family)
MEGACFPGEANVNGRFAGQVALVAGGTGGLGRAVSLAFLEEGATVALPYHRASPFEALRNEGGPAASRLEGFSTDVTSQRAVGELVRAIMAKHGRLDAMVNAVGGYAAGANLWDTDPKVFEQMFALNFWSGFVLARAVAPEMVKQGHGAIVNVASKAAVDHAAASGAYAASKAAAVAMIDSLAADLKGTPVRANSILPSIIDTEANRKAMPSADFSKWPKPQDIARVILFLCSDDAKLIQGASITV